VALQARVRSVVGEASRTMPQLPTQGIRRSELGTPPRRLVFFAGTENRSRPVPQPVPRVAPAPAAATGSGVGAVRGGWKYRGAIAG
jgi:hypothetical protein